MSNIKGKLEQLIDQENTRTTNQITHYVDSFGGSPSKLLYLIEELEKKDDVVTRDEADLYMQDHISDYEFFGPDHCIAGVKYLKGIEIGRLERNKEILDILKAMVE